jgi:branched-chain amino acid transport system substrate-binding protein
MSEAAKAFTAEWQAEYPDKDPNVNSALGYVTYMLIMDAIERANSSDPEAITKALAETKDFATPIGTLTINATHDAELPVGVIQYKEGKRVYVGEASAN